MKAGLVIGVECEFFYEAIEAGIPTILIGSGEKLYSAICDKPIVIKF